MISLAVGREISILSGETGRRIGLLIGRKGTVEFVIVGEPSRLMIPNLERFRYGLSRFKGLRLVHTLRPGEALNSDDMADLALLRLDAVIGVERDDDGEPVRIEAAHLLPKPRDGSNIESIGPIPFSRSVEEVDFLDLIQSLEEEFASLQRLHDVGGEGERALLVSVSSLPKAAISERLNELAELAQSSNLQVVGRIVQSGKRQRSATLLRKGKLSEIVIHALQKGADLLIFDQDLNASQVKNLTDAIELKIIDRTQLILDIFAQRAQTREGRIQVELAQLKYMLPRLVTKNTALSRLTGGIGSRGPGETKLEINRRRARERIARLQSELEKVRLRRKTQRKLRQNREVPIVAIVGYTNAGKSTLLNTLTKSHVFVQNRLFATLDPTSRRLKFPKDREIVVTDTVGFIHDLPRDLIEAFRATLEQLADAHLLLQLVDVSNGMFEQHIEVVERILHDLELDHIPRVMVFNKEDLVSPAVVAQESARHHALSVSALDEETLRPLIEEIERRFWPEPRRMDPKVLPEDENATLRS